MQPGSHPCETAAQPRLLLVDGHAYSYRAFYAIRSLTSPTGRATNAIYGFIRMFEKMRAALNPSHLAVVWDGGLAAERVALLPEYKAQRPEMPEDLRPQFDEIVAYLRAARVVSVMQDGHEADDGIATLARSAEAAGWRVVIASADKDFMQLVSAQVQLLNPNDKSETLWGAEQVRAKSGVEPTQIVDWLSLLGDAVDNIPGVDGVGPKTAAELLKQFGTIDALYGRLAEVRSDRLRENLTKAAAAVRRNQEMVRLHEDTPVGVTLSELAVAGADTDGLRRLLEDWGFRSMVKELDRARGAVGELFELKAVMA